MQDENNNMEEIEGSNKDQFKEPLAIYKRPKIRIFNSYEEQREEMYKYWASITPLQRMAHLLEMTIAFYGLTPEKLKNPGLVNKIKIIHKDGFSA